MCERDHGWPAVRSFGVPHSFAASARSITVAQTIRFHHGAHDASKRAAYNTAKRRTDGSSSAIAGGAADSAVVRRTDQAANAAANTTLVKATADSPAAQSEATTAAGVSNTSTDGIFIFVFIYASLDASQVIMIRPQVLDLKDPRITRATHGVSVRVRATRRTLPRIGVGVLNDRSFL